MMLARTLEPELMDSPAEATAYDEMDHREVNRLFVGDLCLVLESRLGLTDRDAFQVLDLGTGTAQIPIELCRRASKAEVLAVDAALSMLEVARRNVEAAALADRIRLQQVDAKKLELGPRRWQVVMSNSIVHHIPNPAVVLRAAVRVTAPGGLLFFRDLLRPTTDSELQHLVNTYATDATLDQQQMFADSLRAALTLGEIRDLVVGLGFARDTVDQTSDRHWTWTATKPHKS
jgi:ubiquinone/menaquinone biosynthesis C-methylase UbiE